MADTGQITPPIKPPTQGGGGRGALVVQIIKLPQALENNARPVRLEGEITQINKNNETARIQTENGDIEVKIRGRQAPSEGQRIIVDVPAGRPPRQATIQQNNAERAPRPSPSNNPVPTPTASQNVSNTPSPQTQGPRPVVSQGLSQPAQNVSPDRGQPTPSTNYQPTTASTTSATNTAPRSSAPPLPPEIQAALTRNATVANVSASPQAQPLTPESVVRLIPVQPAQAQAIAIEFNQSITPQPAALTRIAFTANLISQNTLQTLPQNLLQIPQPSSAAAALPATQNFTPQVQNALQPIINNGFFTPTPAPQTINLLPPAQGQPAAGLTQLTPFPATQIIPNGQTVPIETGQTLLTQTIQTLPPSTPQSLGTQTISPPGTTNSNIAAPLPILYDPANAASFLTPRTTPIDAQVIQINPPNAVLTPPQNTIQPLPAATVFTPAVIGNSPATSITAQVTGFTAQGLPMVTTQWPGSPLPQSFILQHNSSNLSIGSQLQVTLKAPPAPQLLPTQPLSNPLLRGFQWPAIDDLYNGLLQISPQAAASLTRSLPTPGNALQIAPAAMMFIAAVKSGDIGQWLGQNKIDLLQRAGRDNLLSRLTQSETAVTRSPAGETSASGDWRAVPLPMFWEGEIHKITLYTRNENENQQQQDNQNGQTRFIFDLSLSRMGDVQLDGLLRDQRLDLVIRTQHAFSEPMQQTMRQAYTNALDHTDLRGDLNFQGSTKNWVHVLEKNEQLGMDA